MAKTPPPDAKLTKESGKAAALNKALADKKTKDGDGKKKIFDPRRDPKSYTQDEMIDMVKDGEITPTFTDQNLTKFVLGEITWAELTGLTMQDAYAFAEIAYNLFEQGKYDQAQTVVEGLVISNPYDGYFHSLLGSIYGRKGMHEEAQEEYSIALELNPKDLASYVNRAEILLQHGEIEAALDDLKKAVELDPKGEQPFGIRARALAQATVSVLEEAMRDRGMDVAKIRAQGEKMVHAERAAGKSAAKGGGKPAHKPAPKQK
jgi:tetratricopeptide (TPR) repeat protein